MANPHVNKVQLSDGTTVMDLTGDTVTSGDLLTGVTAHDRSGAQITGSIGDFAGSDHGLVPASGSGDQSKFLRGDGAWATALTSYTETDPTVPSWAKASSKPSYTASEVGAVPTTRTVNGKALSSNISLTASDVSALPSSTTIPTKTSDLTNDSGFLTSVPNHSATKITSDTLSADRLPTSGVTAGSYGPSSNSSPGRGGTFYVPYVTVDNKGRVTAASSKTITMPTAAVSSVNGYTGAVSLTIPTITKTTATLSSSSWNSTSKTQSVTVSGVTSSNTVIVTPAPADIATWTDGNVRCTAQAANSLTFTADTNPTANITVNVVIM